MKYFRCNCIITRWIGTSKYFPISRSSLSLSLHFRLDHPLPRFLAAATTSRGYYHDSWTVPVAGPRRRKERRASRGTRTERRWAAQRLLLRLAQAAPFINLDRISRDSGELFRKPSPTAARSHQVPHRLDHLLLLQLFRPRGGGARKPPRTVVGRRRPAVLIPAESTANPPPPPPPSTSFRSQDGAFAIH